MARKVTEDDVVRWEELRKKGYTYERIGKETGWNTETVRKYVGKGEKPPVEDKEELETDIELQARAFSKFRSGKGPADLVEEKICTADAAQALWIKFGELGGGPKLKIEEMEKRIRWLEESVLSLGEFCASNLNRGWECPGCKTVGNVAVHFKCTACGRESWWGYHPDKK